MNYLSSDTTLPCDWDAKPIREAFITTEKPRGLQPRSLAHIPFIPMEAVPVAGWGVKSPEQRAGNAISSGVYIEDGDLLLAKITPSFENGKQGFAALDGVSFAYGSTELIPLKAKHGKGVLEYLYAVLLHPSLRSALAGKMEGSTGRQRLRKEVLLSTPIPLPPVDEQRQIARVLATVQRAIEHQQQIIETTRELKRSMMHKLFTEGLRGEPQKQAEIGLVPASWDVTPLASCGVQIEYGLSKAIPKEKPRDGIKIVSTADITRDGNLLYGNIRYIEAPATTIKRLTLRTGDVLFNWRNSAELIGKSAVYEDQVESHIFAPFILRIRCDESLSHNYYLKHLFNWYREKQVFVQLARRAVNQANYNKNEISVLKIPRPPHTEQIEIANALNLVDDRIAVHQSRLLSLRDMFRTLLHQLMTAQIRVHELNLDALGVPPLD